MEPLRTRISRVELVIQPFAAVLAILVYQMKCVNGLMGLSGVEHAQAVTVRFMSFKIIWGKCLLLTSTNMFSHL